MAKLSTLLSIQYYKLYSSSRNLKGESNLFFWPMSIAIVAVAAILTVRSRKKSSVALSDRLISKNEIKKIRVGECTQFLTDWVFFHLFEKKGGKCTKIWYFWVLFKKYDLKKYIFSDRPTQIFRNSSWGNPAIFFFWPHAWKVSYCTFGWF